MFNFRGLSYGPRMICVFVLMEGLQITHYDIVVMTYNIRGHGFHPDPKNMPEYMQY